MGAKAPVSTWFAIRRVIVVVLPEPAPARMQTGPRTASTAARCCGFRSAKTSTPPRLRAGQDKELNPAHRFHRGSEDFRVVRRLELDVKSSYGRSEVGVKKNVVIWVAVAVLGLIVVTALGLFVADPDRRAGAINQRVLRRREHALGDRRCRWRHLEVRNGCATRATSSMRQPGADGVIRKHLSAPRHEPCVIEVTSAMGKPVYDWIQAMLNRNALPKNVTLIIADYQLQGEEPAAAPEHAPDGGCIPALSDATEGCRPRSSDPAAGSSSRRSTANAGTTQGTVGAKPKAWIASNFRSPCPAAHLRHRVGSVSALEVTQEGVAGFRRRGEGNSEGPPPSSSSETSPSP